MQTVAPHSIQDLDCAGKRVLMRVDFNTPLKDGKVADDTRIQAALPSINYLLDRGAKLILMSHLGRPAGSGFEEEFSMKPVAQRLVELLPDRTVHFVSDICGEAALHLSETLNEGELMLLENLRFDPREKANDASFAALLAKLADMYVNDAFGVSHRAHASVEAITKYLPSYSGFLLQKELEHLEGLSQDPARPFVAVLGGSKVSDKVGVINKLMDKCDSLIIGGGMCFTFLKAQGYEVGRSLLQEDWIESCKEMLDQAQKKGVNLLLPQDLIVADALAEDARIDSLDIDAIPEDMMGLDIGPKTIEAYKQVLASAKTIFWNGPMGVFEIPLFERGTKAIAQAMADNKEALTIIGGGDSVAAVKQFNLADEMSFISTGGGASMNLVEGTKLPGVEALRW